MLKTTLINHAWTFLIFSCDGVCVTPVERSGVGVFGDKGTPSGQSVKIDTAKAVTRRPLYKG